MDNNNNKNTNQGQNKGNGNIGQTLFGIAIAVVLTAFIWQMFSSSLFSNNVKDITYSQFVEYVDQGVVKRVEIGEDIYVYLDNEKMNESQGLPTETTESKSLIDEVMKQVNATSMRCRVTKVEDPELMNRLLNQKGIEIVGVKSSFLQEIIIGWIVPFIFIMFLFNMLSKRMGGAMGGGIMGIGKSNAKRYMQKETGVTFNDVAGEDEAKESLVEIVDFLHNPQKYTVVGAKLPKGALLVGPPGTGKTLLAKAVAGEAKVPFFSLTGSDFVEMYAGVGASRVRDLFKQAQSASPCIVFIDEIDAIGRSRDARSASGADSEREQTLNQLLSEMDGFDVNKGIMVMAATNRPEVLDQALLRPGRFDRRIIVEKPDLKGRVAILKVHSKDVKMDKSVDFDEIALSTSGAVGADLANMINEAAINAAKHSRKEVSQLDLFEAVEVVLVGKEKKDRVLSKEERRIVSYHEVGHALVSAMLKHSEPVQKITIVPRTMGALGYVLQTPEEEKYLNTKKELEARLITFLSGRAAEEIVFDTVTTGAANDIEEATKLARAMITQYGMSTKFGLMGLETKKNMYLGDDTLMNCGDNTATLVDEEVKKMLEEAHDKAKEILNNNREALDRISDYLIQKETITGKEFMNILSEITGLDFSEKKDRVNSSSDDKKEDIVAQTKEESNEKLI
ncbi:MAG: ATP-dependent zinc metalloprotease FtsH [Eubacteriales bacterium]|nr:ATP-dependent zinc metalloprotease FtsH [Eubacteriales bacterium]